MLSSIKVLSPVIHIRYCTMLSLCLDNQTRIEVVFYIVLLYNYPQLGVDLTMYSPFPSVNTNTRSQSRSRVIGVPYKINTLFE